MAHHRSAKKRIRQTERVTQVLKARRNRVRTFIKRVDSAVEANDVEKANSALRDAQSELMRGVSKGVFKKATASRKVSRLSARVKSLKQAA